MVVSISIDIREKDMKRRMEELGTTPPCESQLGRNDAPRSKRPSQSRPKAPSKANPKARSEAAHTPTLPIHPQERITKRSTHMPHHKVRAGEVGKARRADGAAVRAVRAVAVCVTVSQLGGFKMEEYSKNEPTSQDTPPSRPWAPRWPSRSPQGGRSSLR
jgi:hypothetical protein